MNALIISPILIPLVTAIACMYSPGVILSGSAGSAS
jgi:hypothetical protein